MGYTCRIFDSIDDVDLASWQRVRSECDEPIFMDPRFVAAVEISMKQSCRFWHIIVYNEDALPVACASLSTIMIDLLDTVDPRLASIVRYLIPSTLRKLKLLVCGLPVSAGQKALTLALPRSSPEILSTLDAVISPLASKMRVHAIIYKEFGKDDLEWANPLLNLGYQCIESVPMNSFRPSFQDLQHYCAALRAHHRIKIKRSIGKLKSMDVEISILTDPNEIIRAYTPEVHSLYHQTLKKANIKFENLPIEFFHELTIHLRDQIDLIILSKNSKIVAFSWCLRGSATYHMLYGGIDYEMNSKADLYFNVMYASLDRALRQQVSKIQFGQTANVFKARLGCYSEPLYVFVKGLGPLISQIVRYGAHLLVAREPAAPAFNVFKSHTVKN